MPRQTRSSAQNSPVKAVQLASKTEKHAAPGTLILPKHALQNTDARLLTLNDPRDGRRRQFYFDPSSGLHEFTKINAPSIDPRSILFAPQDNQESNVLCVAQDTGIASGYTSQKADILIATKVDIVFHMIPILHASIVKSKRDAGKGLFLSLDDLLDSTEDDETHIRHVVQNETYRPDLERQLKTICDIVDAGDEKMFRLNDNKVMDMILQKARRMVKYGLPRSMEERFITRTLEAPVLSVKREDSRLTIPTEAPLHTESISESFETVDSQSTITTLSSAASSAVISDTSSFTTTDTPSEDTAPEGIRELLRLQTAIAFITASYLNSDTAAAANVRLAAKDSPIDFAVLNDHVTHLASLRTEAAASRSFSDFSRKRGSLEDDDVAEVRAEKKRKLEEEEKRKKAGLSRGVRDLKKADVSGMKKMSDFFKTGPAAKAKS